MNDATEGKDPGLDKADTGDAEKSLKVPLLSEALDITKVEVDRGGYRIHKRVATRIENVKETLNFSSVEIERRAIGTPLPDGMYPSLGTTATRWSSRSSKRPRHHETHCAG